MILVEARRGRKLRLHAGIFSMWIVQTIRQQLDKQGVKYRLLALAPFSSLHEAASAARLPTEAVVNTALLRDQFGLLMAVVPCDAELSLPSLRKALKRDVEIIPIEEQRRLLLRLDPVFIPPLGETLGIKTVVDDALAMRETVYFPAGDNNHLFEVDARNFHLLQRNAMFVTGIARARIAEPASAGPQTSSSVGPMILVRQRLGAVTRLPAIPEMASKIIQLNNNPYAHVNDLANVISRDPSLAAQVMRYAASPLYGFGNAIDSLSKAIKILGYDVVMHLALGIATGKPFKIARSGPLGLRAYWRHATHSAALVQALGRELPRELRPRPGLSYLTGLLHNFGQLIIGELLRKEFDRVNELVAEQPERPLIEIEQELLGFHHGHVGAWLLERWELPEEIVTACREHHNARYHGPHATYARLAHAADALLRGAGIGNGPESQTALLVMQSLQLDPERAEAALQKILEEASCLNELAQQLAA